MEWILTQNKLPDNEKQCLLYGEIAFETEDGIFKKEVKPFVGTYIGAYNEYASLEGSVVSVSHWMPLPALPIQ